MDAAHCDRISVRGELSPPVRAFFENMSLESADGTTVRVGGLVGQAHLAGVLNHVQGIGLERLSGNQVEPRPLPVGEALRG